jgi:ribonucleoside-diphosphate reductase alpha chain
VDHGISSTINLPEPVEFPEDIRYFGDTLMTYLPHLRGVTVYPDGARSGQPLTVATYAEAHKNLGVTLEENRDQQCASGVCGV